MKKLFNCTTIICLTALLGCHKKDSDPIVYPIEPHIEFTSLNFIKGSAASGADTLKLQIYFHDGDFDLGLSDSDYTPPFNYCFYYNNSNGQPIPNSNFDYDKIATQLNQLITFKVKRKIHPDSLPDFVTPYSCSRWLTIANQAGVITDTLYYQQNSNYYNFFVEFEQQDANFNYQPVNFQNIFIYPNCTAPYPFNDRFNFDNKGRFIVKKISSQEGTLIYNMASGGFTKLFAGHKIKLTVSIQDRALHRSNQIETSEIQF